MSHTTCYDHDCTCHKMQHEQKQKAATEEREEQQLDSLVKELTIVKNQIDAGTKCLQEHKII